MKKEAKLMKNRLTSDISTMVQPTMDNPAVRLAIPATALIWGLGVYASAGTAIWGTLAIGGAGRKQNCSAIWGTCGIGGPTQNAWTLRPSMEIDG
jgi:hypothetical protein